MAHVTAIIPARLHSTRFPKKALYPLHGKPLIYHVWKAASKASRINRLFVATDSEEIGRAVMAFGGAVIMTSGKPRNGTERAAEAVTGMKTDLVVNIQADNLRLSGAILDRFIASTLSEEKTRFSTLGRRIAGAEWKKEVANPNVVKVVCDNDGHALWFSRSFLPFIRKNNADATKPPYPFMEHIGIYAYSKSALLDYTRWPVGKAEQSESLEQLRILENGARIRLFETRAGIVSVDTRAALKLLELKAV